jgi:hypothetical protein
MATANLTVKFKVDTSEVKQGADEAKNKVKSAAQSMSSDVRQASSSMKSSLGDVQNAAQGIERATKSASNAVGQMERQVSQSASRMSSDLSGVAQQIKNISARQAGAMVARGLGMLGSAVTSYAENRMENGSPGQAGTKVAGAALSGAATGIAMGSAAGPWGMLIGGAAGALIGAAKAQREAADELKKAAQDRQRNAQDNLQKHAADLDERDRKAAVDRENNILINGIGKTWWQNKSTGETITGNDRIRKIQEGRQAEVDRISKERDDYIKAHRNDTGEDAVKSSIRLDLFDKDLARATERLEALAPVVDALKKAEQEAADAEKKRKEKFEKASAALDEKVQAYALKGQKEEIKDEIRGKESTISELQSKLQGSISSPLVGNLKVDSLTRIGGGRGYAAYNNSAANVQAKIENHLKELIKIEQTQLTELNTKLENLTTVVQNKGSTAEWAS